MTSSAIDDVVRAALYEGYVLYPYRASSKKNARQRFTFGRVYPSSYSVAQHGAEPCLTQTECLVRTHSDSAMVEVHVRFLHPLWREVGRLTEAETVAPGAEPHYEVVPELLVGERRFQTWQEAVEREVSLAPLTLRTEHRLPITQWFMFPSSRWVEPVHGSQGPAGVLVRRQEALEGAVEVKTATVREGLMKLTVRVLNHTPLGEDELTNQDAVLMRTLASAHTVLHLQGGEFLSLTAPPPGSEPEAKACKNIGTWPVLIGDEETAERATMLSSPIILPDYPRVAPESGGDFFDSTEIDEMLTLRVMTMTDAEKSEMRDLDGFTRRLLERTESMSAEQFLGLHGVMRDAKAAESFFNPLKRVASAHRDGVEIKAGSKVRIRPRHRADAMDLMLAGKLATVEAVEQDAEDKIHLALVLDDDPGKDLGLLRQPGHRFFYGVDEVQPVEEALP